MTASSTLRSRLLSSWDAISAKLRTTSNNCQVGGEAIEAQPPRGREYQFVVANRPPTRGNPRLSTNKFRTGETQTAARSQREIDVFGGSIDGIQHLTSIDWILSSLQPP